jgi:cysteine desulfurase / selenocysteine lyase
VRYLSALGMQRVREREHLLTQYLLRTLSSVPNVTVYGPSADERGGVASFNVDGVHPHDVASVLDQDNIAVRAGHHCCQPLMRALDVNATTRASVYFYNTTEEIDTLARGLERVRQVFRV